MSIRALPDDSYYQRNVMYYMPQMAGEDFSQPSTIMFDVFMATEAFREITTNLKNSFIPEKITIELIRDQSLFFSTAENQKIPLLEYSWEPDGSGMVWHNKERENQKIPIKSIKFDYVLVKPRYDEQAGRLLPIQPEIAQAHGASEQIGRIETTLVELLKYLGIITFT